MISALQLKTQKAEYFKKLMDKKVTAVAFDYIKDEEQVFPIVRSMGEIAGTSSILIAAELLSTFSGVEVFLWEEFLVLNLLVL